MTATTSVPLTQDIPFAVKGYVTDPKLVGYQILTNYESTYWAPLIGMEAWRLYEVLRSFCHQGHNSCHPSINLLLAITGIKDRSVLIGRSKAKIVKGKKYYYPGLIQILQDHNLVIAEVAGDGPKLRYTFHVNMTPGLLTDEHLAQLPDLLQKKHVALLERCESELRKLEAKKRPRKIHKNDTEPEPNTSAKQGIGISNRGIGNSNTPYWKFQYKQHPYNNTHITSASVHVDHNNNSGGDTNPQNAVVVALIDHGISQQVAQRLAKRHSKERILQKIEFLKFLLEEDPDNIQKPAAWLRRAIEEDYGTPDGYLSQEERERLAAEEAQRAAEEERHAIAAAERKRSLQEKAQAEHTAAVDVLRAEHDTTEEDLAFWERAQLEIKYTATSEVNSLVSELEMLRMRDGTAILGAWSEATWRRLQHPGTAKIISRALSQVAGQPVEIQSVEIQDSASSQSKASEISAS